MMQNENYILKVLKESSFREDSEQLVDIEKIRYLLNEKKGFYVNDFMQYFLDKYHLLQFVDVKKGMYSIMQDIYNNVIFKIFDVRELAPLDEHREVNERIINVYSEFTESYKHRYELVIYEMKLKRIKLRNLKSLIDQILIFVSDIFDDVAIFNFKDFYEIESKLKSISDYWEVLSEIEREDCEDIIDEKMRKIIKLQLLDIIYHVNWLTRVINPFYSVPLIESSIFREKLFTNQLSKKQTVKHGGSMI